MLWVAALVAICLDFAFAVFIATASWRTAPTIDGEEAVWLTSIGLFAILNVFLLVAGLALRHSFKPQKDHPGIYAKRPVRSVGFWTPIFAVAVFGAALGVWAGFSVTEAERARQQELEKKEAEAEQKLDVGDVASEIAARTVDDVEWRLADHAGRAVLLHFWASWDDESVGSLLRLRRLSAEHEGMVDVVSVCLDPQPEPLRELCEDLGVGWPQLFEPEKGWENSLATAFGVRRVPQVWIVSRDGRVVARDLRGGSIDDRLGWFLRDDRMRGQTAPEIESRTLDGSPWRLSEHRGSVVLVDFWATWCGPCLAEIPHLKAIHEQFGARNDFLMVSLSLDAEAEPVRELCLNEEIGWLQLHDPGLEFDHPAVAAYEVNGIPSIWLIDRDGLVVGIDLRGDDIATAIASALE
jgi:thiol-disulfide isomerase/thioredoxin